MGSILYVEPFSGIAGDMFVAALLDLGADVPEFWNALDSLPIRAEFEARTESVARSGIKARRFIVDAKEQHAHCGHHNGRNLAEIEEIINGALVLSPKDKQLSIGIFRALAEAEAKVHGEHVAHVHFHEVGAVDAIVDIVAASVAFHLLHVDTVISDPPSLGGGTVKTAHGILPVPAPATFELLTGVPSRRGPIESELTTPTGAAILKVLASAWIAPGGIVERIGYGAGSKEFAGLPNVLRCSIVSSRAREVAVDEVVVVECNLDDTTGESISHLGPRLFASGALDYAIIPATMKKSRLGMIIQVLAPPDARGAVVDALLRETTTFGVRWRIEKRKTLRRILRTISTPLGPLQVKIGFDESGHAIKAKPEADAVSELARTSGKSYIEVMREISEDVSQCLKDNNGTVTTD